MIFQDPMTSLNPSMQIGTQIREVLHQHKAMSRAESRARAIELLRLVGIPEPEVAARCSIRINSPAACGSAS